MPILYEPAGVAPGGPPGAPQFGPSVSLTLLGAGQDNPEQFTFPVGVEEEVLAIPARATILYALGGIYVYHLGTGLRTIVLSGTLGLRTAQDGSAQEIRGASAQDLAQTPGYRNMRALLGIVQRYQESAGRGDGPTLLLALNNPNGTGAYEIVPQALQLFRSHTRPALVPYVLKAAIVADHLNGEGGQGGDGAAAALLAASDAAALQEAVRAAGEISPPRTITYITHAGDTLNSVGQQAQATPGYGAPSSNPDAGSFGPGPAGSGPGAPLGPPAPGPAAPPPSAASTVPAIARANLSSLVGGNSTSTPLPAGTTLLIPSGERTP